MRASAYDNFGPAEVLSTAEVGAPAARSGVARVEVHAAALNPKDVLIRKGKMRWLGRNRWPRIPGYDFAGVLLDDAAGLAAGTEVFGMVQSHLGGACAEVVAVPFDQLAAKPPSLSMVDAAALPLAALTALQALRDELEVRPGQRILLNGASGGVGTFAVQIAKALELEVVAVCSGKNAAFVAELGADRVIDYTAEPLTDQTDLDAVFDIYGSFPWEIAKGVLRRGGRFCTTIPRIRTVARGFLRRVGLHHAALVVVESKRSDLDVLAGMVERGALRPVIDTVVSLDDAAAGHLRLETRRTRGKVVVSVR